MNPHTVAGRIETSALATIRVTRQKFLTSVTISRFEFQKLDVVESPAEPRDGTGILVPASNLTHEGS